jgi:hypothetical protein
MNPMALLKSYFVLGAALSVFLGIVSIESYFSYFGLEYYDLGIPWDHLIYRGVVLSFSNISIAAIHASALLVFFLAEIDARLVVRGKQITRLTYGSLALFGVVVGGFFVAREVGFSKAVSDMYPETTELRALVGFHSSDSLKQEFVTSLLTDDRRSLLILVAAKDQLALFTTPRLRSATPSVAISRVPISNGDIVQSGQPRR